MLISCQGWPCRRLISVSATSGPNPVAVRDPETFALVFATCSDCKHNFCDRCMERKNRLLPPLRCHDCLGRLVMGSRYEDARRSPWPDAVLRHNEGVELAEAGRYEAAATAFERAAVLRPDYIAAHFLRGQNLRRLGRDADALVAFDRTVALDAGHGRALLESGAACLRLHRLDEAAGSFRRVIEAEPDHVAAHIDMAAVLTGLRRPEAAIAACDAAIAITERGAAVDDVPHARALAHGVRAAALMDLDRWDEALAAVDVAVDTGPDDRRTFLNRARILDELGRPGEAGTARRLAEDVDRLPRTS